ncbi:AraC family transcriptional regulator [Bartonella sp. LJL80]
MKHVGNNVYILKLTKPTDKVTAFSMPTIHSPFAPALPAEIIYRTADMPENSAFEKHRHQWGEFVYCYSGIMEIQTADNHYLATTRYGLWLPPDLEHLCMNRRQAHYCSIYIANTRLEGLPKKICMLEVDQLALAMLDHLRHQSPQLPYEPHEMRFLDVFKDRLSVAVCAESYLPTSSNPVMRRVLDLLESDTQNALSLKTIAKRANLTERTLMRLAEKHLGMSLTQWRQRHKIIRAIPMLTAGEKVETVALQLGYQSASAFISMFRRLMGCTPDEYRKSLLIHEKRPDIYA